MFSRFFYVFYIGMRKYIWDIVLKSTRYMCVCIYTSSHTWLCQVSVIFGLQLTSLLILYISSMDFVYWLLVCLMDDVFSLFLVCQWYTLHVLLLFTVISWHTCFVCVCTVYVRLTIVMLLYDVVSRHYIGQLLTSNHNSEYTIRCSVMFYLVKSMWTTCVSSATFLDMRKSKFFFPPFVAMVHYGQPRAQNW